MTWLVTDALVVSDDHRVLVRRGTSVVSATLDTYEAPTAFMRRLREQGIAAFESRCHDPADLTTLVAALDSVGCVANDQPYVTLPAGTFSLSQCPTPHTLLEEPITMTLVTSGEALVVRDASFALFKRALRMFISRMEDPYRLSAYGAQVAGEMVLALSGDVPTPQRLAWLRSQPTEVGATTLSLDSLRHTGTLTESDGAVRGVGRLAVGEVLAERVLVDPKRSATWTVAMGHTAHPNLRVLNPFDKPESFVSGTTGVSQVGDLARLKASAEAVERFVSGDLDADRLHRVAASDLRAPWLHPHEAISYDSRQRRSLGLSEFDEDREEWWVAGKRGDGDCYLPAALVYCPFPAVPTWLHWSATSSNGVAAHRTAPQAALSAWLELVERDAFQRARLSRGRAGGWRIDLSTLPGEVSSALVIAREFGDVTVLRLPGPTGIPVCLARVDLPVGLALGMAAGPTEAGAAAKALSEAVAQAIAPFHHKIDVRGLRGPGDHAALYAQLRWRKRLDWMLQAPLRSALEGAVPCALPEGVYVYEFPSEPSADLAVVRVIDPSLIPLTFGYDTDPLGRDDVRACASLGGWGGTTAIDPHPFA